MAPLYLYFDQEAIGHNSLPLVVDSLVSSAQVFLVLFLLLLKHLLITMIIISKQGDLKKITEGLKSEKFNLQIFEV